MSPTTTEPGSVAPVDPGDDEAAEAPAPAPVFPTEADIEAITAALLAKDADAYSSERQLTRAVQAEIEKQAERLSRTRVRRPELLDAVVAPVFPTEDHVAALHASIPTLTDAELRSVLGAGHAAFVASVDAGEPITTPPEEAA